MDKVLAFWKNGLPPRVKLVFLLLMGNAVPAFIVLNLFTGQTKDWFVWTITPDASARLLAVMYGNALLLVVIGLVQPNWARARITLVVITFFSIAATIVTFLNLTPFLQHPWYHLTYWLTMYLLLFVAAPITFFLYERREGGRLPVDVPLSGLAKAVALVGAVGCLATGLGLFIDPKMVSEWWPWNLTPLVARILGVWFSSLGLAYLWAFWDGDWQRTRPIFWQAPPTGLFMALVPLIHSKDLRPGTDGPLTLYVGLALVATLANLAVILVEQRQQVTIRASKVANLN